MDRENVYTSYIRRLPLTFHWKLSTTPTKQESSKMAKAQMDAQETLRSLIEHSEICAFDGIVQQVAQSGNKLGFKVDEDECREVYYTKVADTLNNLPTESPLVAHFTSPLNVKPTTKTLYKGRLIDSKMLRKTTGHREGNNRLLKTPPPNSTSFSLRPDEWINDPSLPQVNSGRHSVPNDLLAIAEGRGSAPHSRNATTLPKTRLGATELATAARNNLRRISNGSEVVPGDIPAGTCRNSAIYVAGDAEMSIGTDSLGSFNGVASNPVDDLYFRSQVRLEHMKRGDETEDKKKKAKRTIRGMVTKPSPAKRRIQGMLRKPINPPNSQDVTDELLEVYNDSY